MRERNRAEIDRKALVLMSEKIGEWGPVSRHGTKWCAALL